jgi:hypothetical protein
MLGSAFSNERSLISILEKGWALLHPFSFHFEDWVDAITPLFLSG